MVSLRTVMNSKIHRATVTEADINYIGSITIDEELVEAANISEWEKIEVLNITNGSRLETHTGMLACARAFMHACLYAQLGRT